MCPNNLSKEISYLIANNWCNFLQTAICVCVNKRHLVKFLPEHGKKIRLTTGCMGASQACSNSADKDLPFTVRPDIHFSLDSICSVSSGMKFSQD
jgi:hypothetical protein